MFKIFNNIESDWLKADGEICVYDSIESAQFAVRVCVLFGNDKKMHKHRWTKKDFQIVAI
jgi:hypothetical protein